MHSKNLTLLTDLYELTMMQGYYDKQDNPTVIFDVLESTRCLLASLLTAI